MNYQHPSQITPVEGRRYVVFCADGQPRLTVWRGGMMSNYCTVTVKKRTTQLDVVNGPVLLVAELPIPTREQIDAACDVENKLMSAAGAGT